MLIKIRKLGQLDMKQWVDLVRQLFGLASIGVLTDRSAWVDLTQLQDKDILVAEDDGKIVGTVSIFYEVKVNRGTTEKRRLYQVAHIEEMVVDLEYRDKGIDKQLMDEAVKLAKTFDCYKIILDCSEDNVPFYEKCGFHKHEISMRLDL